MTESTAAVPARIDEPLPVSSSVKARAVAPRIIRRQWRAGVHRILGLVPALVPAAIIFAIVYTLADASKLVYLNGFFGFHFDPSVNSWGVGVFVVGSFLTAVPALTFSMVIGLGIGIASAAYLPTYITRLLDPFVDFLAGIPSVVYGIWAFLILGPIFGHDVNPWLAGHLQLIPGFGPPSGDTLGVGLPLAIFILTLMALPITTLLIRDALHAVPRDLWESGLALGATRWEVMRRVSIPYSTRGIVSAAFLGFGRAFGETVAVAMVIGFVIQTPYNFYGTTSTIAAAMFELLDSAYGNSHYLAVLAEVGLVLLVITLVVNILGRRLISGLAHYDIAGL